MTRLLAIETSTAACSVAVTYDDEIDEQFVVAPQDHTQRLLPMVDAILTKHHIALNDLDAIVFTGGPGSFTGLRICLGVVQGLAFGADLPVIKISTLEVMAQSAWRLLALSEGTLIVPALDARMDEIYWGAYAVRAQGLQQIVADAVNDPADLQRALITFDKPIIGVGDGWCCGELAKQQPSDVSETIPEFYPHAWDLALLGIEQYRLQRGQSVLDVFPTYIRNEVRWKKRQRIRKHK